MAFRRGIVTLVAGSLLTLAPRSGLGAETPVGMWQVGLVWCDPPRPGFMPQQQTALFLDTNEEALADEVCRRWEMWAENCYGAPPDRAERAPHTRPRYVYTPEGIPQWFHFHCTNEDPQTGSEKSIYFGSTPDFRPKDRGACDTCVGNPIAYGTGNKHEPVSLYESPSAGGVNLTIHYNSTIDRLPRAFGPGWSHSYERIITALPRDRPLVATAWRADGEASAFSHTTSAGWQADPDVPDSLSAMTDAAGAIVGWTYANAADQTVETYDERGLLSSIEDRHQRVTTLIRSDETTPADLAPWPGLLLEVTDPYGRSLDFTYDSTGLVATMVDPAGGQYLFAYDENANLTSITWPDHTTRTFVYGESANTAGRSRPNALTGIVDELGARFATFRYDTTGRAVYSGHAGGAEAVTLDFGGSPLTNGATNQTRVTDALGTTRTLGVTSVLSKTKTTALTEPCSTCAGGSRASARTYDANGNVATTTDFRGSVTRYEHDPATNLETRRVEAAGTSSERTIETTWDGARRLRLRVVERDRAGVELRRRTFTWSGAGDLLTETITDAQRGTTVERTATYDAAGRVLTQDGPRTDVTDVTTYSYYPENASCPTVQGGDPVGCRGALERITDALGHATTYAAYDGHGKPLVVVDPNGVATTFTYDARQRLTSRTRDGATTTLTLDAAGQLVRTTLADGSFLDYAYDAAHRLVALQDNLGNRAEYMLDAAGRRTDENIFDAAHDLARARSQTYDELGRILSMVTGTGRRVDFAYDAAGNLLGTTDALGRTWSATFDPLNRLVAELAPDGGRKEMAFDALDRGTSYVDARGHSTTFDFDALGRMLRVTSPEAGTVRKTYDPAGNVVEVTDALGGTSHLTYDALDRLIRVVDARGDEVRLTYDQGPFGVGHLTGVVDASGSRELVYDARGRRTRDIRILTTSRSTLALATEYTYDDADRVASIRYPGGRVVTFTRDAAGRVARVEGTVGGAPTVFASDLTYQPFGGLTSMRGVGGLAMSWPADADGNVAEYHAGGRGASLTRDPAGQVTGLVTTASVSWSVDYDPAGRLTRAAGGGQSFDYEYDASGNLTRRIDLGVPTSFTLDPSSDRVASASGGLSSTYVHDAAGNLVAGGGRVLRYDGRGRLDEVVVGTRRVRYVIDAFGYRVARVLYE